MTSLAQQLKRLAVPHAQSPLVNDKQRVSLLFDPREAATLDRETVYALGISGLEELENVDPAFAEYENSLFNKSSQNWSRSVQTQEVNDQLDAAIGLFLVRLSPYLLLRCSHKALEWLVFRYQIQQYNVDDLILCILPYHDSRIFVRILQLLKLDDPTDKWNWLEPAAKSGVPLARKTFLNHCKKDPGFLALVTRIVPRFIKVHGPESSQLRAVTSLHTGALLSVAEKWEELTERIMSIVVPSLVLGFKSKCMDFKASSYMVLCQIAAETQVKEAVLKQLLPVICKHISPRLSLEALMCLALVFHTQKITSLPKRTFKHLCRIPALVELLASLARQCDVSALLCAWFNKLVPAALAAGISSSGTSSDASTTDDLTVSLPDYDRLLVVAVIDVKLEDAVANFLSKLVLQELLLRRQEAVGDEDEEAVLSWQQQTKELLTALERRYPTAFDTAISDLLHECSGQSDALDVLQDMMSLTISPVKHQIMTDLSTSLLLGLNHPQTSQRLLAVRHLLKSVKEGQLDSSSDAFVQDVLLQRLGDDEADVALAVLNMGVTLCNVVPKPKLVSALFDLTKGHRASGDGKWEAVVMMCLQLLCSPDLVTSCPDLTLTFIPYLAPRNQLELKAADLLLRSEVMERDPLFADLSRDYRKAAKGDNEDGSADEARMRFLNNQVVPHLVNVLYDSPQYSHVMDFLTQQARDSPCPASDFFLLLWILAECFAKMSNSKTRHSKQELSHANLDRSNCSRLFHEGRRLLHLLDLVEQLQLQQSQDVNIFPIIESALLELFQAIGKRSGRYPKDMWLDLADPEPSHSQFLSTLVDLLLREASKMEKWRPILDAFVKCIDFGLLHNLLCGIWSPDGATKVSVLAHVGSFYLASHIWRQKSGQELAGLLQTPRTVLPVLLLSLANPHQAVRKGAIRCLSLLRKMCRSSADPHTYLLKKIVRSKEEILADPKHILQTLGVVYDFRNPMKDREEVDAKNRQSLRELLHFVTGMPTPPAVVERLLHILKEVPHEHVMEKLVVLGGDMLAEFKDDPLARTSTRVDIIEHILQRFDEHLASQLQAGSPSWQLFLMALETPHGANDSKTPQILAMEQITRQLFAALPKTELQCRLVTTLVDVFVSTGSADVANNVQKHLKQLKVQGFHIAQELKVMVDPSEVATVKGQKRTRTRKAPAPIKYDRVVLILEVLQSRKKIKDSHELAEMLFALLERLQNEEAEETEYCKQLVLSCITSISSRWTEENKPEKQECFNVEALVHCIRNSQSPQTQQQALVAMATIAHLFPEYILHNVMSVFTFMGGSLLQQDDSHTFHIITRTVQTVIPALVKAHQTEDSDSQALDGLIASILRVFVDARQHVPPHRSLVLFRKLTETVGTERHLWTVLVLLMEKGVLTKDVPSTQDHSVQDEGLSSLDKDIEFAVKICEQMDCSIEVNACTRVVQLLQQMTKLHATQAGQTTPGRVKAKKMPAVPPLSIESLSAQQLRLLQYHTTRLIVTLLGRESFVNKITSPSNKAVADDVMATEFGTFVRETLSYMTEVARQSGVQGAGSIGKFWKALLHKIYDILEKVNYVLPSHVFLEVSTSLMGHEIATVRKKSLELMNLKLQQLQLGGKLGQEEVTSLLPIVDKLISLVKGDKKHSSTLETDVASMQQMSLLGLKLLCKLIGTQEPQAFKEVFSLTISLLQGKATPPPVLGSCLLCLAELCSTLKAHAIPHLAAFMKPLLKVLKKEELLRSNELLLTCCLTVLQRVVTTLPHFLSHYLCSILYVVCHISCFANTDEGSKKSQAAIRLKAVRHQMAVAIASRVLLPAVAECYEKLLEQNQALSTVLSILREHIEHMSKEDLASQHSVLVNFFCEALDLRNQDLTLTPREVQMVEGESTAAVLTMVVQLSENNFRPMFYKLYDWACRGDMAKSRLRCLAFFRLCEQLSEKLRSLFNLFVGHILKMACQLLDNNNTMKGEVDFYSQQECGDALSCELLGYILGCLYKSMLYDTEGFVSKELFTLMMQPLVDQLENFIGGYQAFEKRISSHVTLCIGQLAVASKDDSSWKSLNYQVLLKTRHANPKVRFSALLAIESLAEKLGEECMVLLPETIPFLAELMEDENEEVEHKCQQVISSLEKILGESLQKYF